MSIAHDLVKAWHNYPALGHSGAEKLYKIMSRQFYWPRMKTTVKAVVKACGICQKLKGNPTETRMHPLLGVEPMQVLQIDFADVTKPSNKGHKALLVAIDVGSRYPFAFALKNKRAETVVSILLKHVFPITGLPQVIHHDNDQAFSSQLWIEIHARLGISRRRSPAFAPQGKGIVERQIQTIKNKIFAVIEGEGPLHGWEKWHEALPFVIWGIRASPGPGGIAPSKTLLGVQVSIPPEAAVTLQTPVTLKPETRQALDFFKARLAYVRKSAMDRIDNDATVRAGYANVDRPLVTFSPGKRVLFTEHAEAQRTSLGKTNQRFRGPYVVVKGPLGDGKVLYEIEDSQGKRFLAHVNNLKECEASTPADEFPQDRTRWTTDEYRAQRSRNEKVRRERVREERKRQRE
jgi:transposase InsO family protein